MQYKQQSRLDERRKKALDIQLDFIVGQTEKYSSWLTEGLNTSTAGSSAHGSVVSSPRSDRELGTDGKNPLISRDAVFLTFVGIPTFSDVPTFFSFFSCMYIVYIALYHYATFRDPRPRSEGPLPGQLSLQNSPG